MGLSAAPVDQELRAGFKRELEAQMWRMVRDLEQLVEMHDRYGGDTLERAYLHKARRELLNGLDWFQWERRGRADPDA